MTATHFIPPLRGRLLPPPLFVHAEQQQPHDLNRGAEKADRAALANYRNRRPRPARQAMRRSTDGAPAGEAADPA
jgi:hypothetical protein